MVFQESKELIVEYIRKLDGMATKNNVADYMEGNDLQHPIPKKYEQYTTSRVTTYALVKELEEAKRINVVKGIRNGQRHNLIFKGRNTFDDISNQIVNIQLMLREHPEAEDHCLNLLLASLNKTNKYIKNENDKQSLIQKIIDAMLKIRYKNEGMESED